MDHALFPDRAGLLPQQKLSDGEVEQTSEVLDGHLLGTTADDLHTLPIVRVLIGVLFNEVVAWTCTLFATLVIPLFVTTEGGFAGLCLGFMVMALVILTLCFGIMIEYRRAKNPPVLYCMAILHTSIATLCVCSAILIHSLATNCFVLMVWTGTLTMLLKLVHVPATLSALQLALFSLYSSIVVCFVCVAQELTLKDLAVNLVAFMLNLLFIAFRYDWLANKADTDRADTNSAYNVTETDRAWLDLYTWTVDARAIERCRRYYATQTRYVPIEQEDGPL